MPAPDLDQVVAYLGEMPQWTTEEVASALAAEKAAQENLCTVPSDVATWPADLTEALCRRVARNLALRALPLGYQQSISEVGGVASTRIGDDVEIRRLEGPYRKWVVA